MYKIRRSLSSGKDDITLINSSNDCNNEIVKDNEGVFNWGIMGCANIARKNCRSIEMSPCSRVHAVASRERKKAEKFRDQNRLSADVKIYEGYDALLNDPEIDAVYIPLPTTMHLEWVVKAANSHKHILIEKPVGIDAEQFYVMTMTCKNNNVLLMDGVMFMHHERLRTLNMLLRDPRCGQIARVDSSFCFNGGKEFLEGGNIRTCSTGDPLGALGDLGWYSVRLGQIAFARGLGDSLIHPEDVLPLPSHCVATCDSWTRDGVPLDCDAKVYFHLPSSSSRPGLNVPERKFGALTFNCSFMLPLRQSYNISITSDTDDLKDQVISCRDFVLPPSPYSSTMDIEIGADLIDNDHRIVGLRDELKLGPCVQEVNMISSFSTIARSGSVAQKSMWAKISCQTQLIVNACFESMKQGGNRVDIPPLQEEYFDSN